MRIFLILAGLMLPLAAAPQEIYRWVDKDGIVHYSDQPGSPNAELVTIVAPNSYEAGDSGAQSPSYAGGDDGADSPLYESLTIVQPSPDQVFFGSDATVNVATELVGTLQPEHTILFYVNGNLRYSDGGGITLTGLPRGSHFVRAVVFDNNTRQAVISSPQITFHVRQASTQNPQNPVPARPQLPSPRPTPTPVPAPTPTPVPTPRPRPVPAPSG
jgi:hypothetical protein